MSWGVDPNVVDVGLCQGRLSLDSTNPIPAADQTAKTSVYWHPFQGNAVALYTGSVWKLYRSSGAKTIAVPNTTSTPFDVFVYDNAGTLALDTVNWTNDTTRAVALATVAGIYVKSGDSTRRYLGTARTTAVAGQSEDSQARRFLWNYYNRRGRKMGKVDTTDNWSYGTASWRAANNSTANRVEVVVGLAEELVELHLLAVSVQAVTAGVRYAGIGINRANGNDADISGEPGNDLAWHSHHARLYHALPVGYSYYQWVEKGPGVGTTTWYGDFGTSNDMQTGLTGAICG